MNSRMTASAIARPSLHQARDPLEQPARWSRAGHHHRPRAGPGLQHLVLDADARAHRCDRHPGVPISVAMSGTSAASSTSAVLASARIQASGCVRQSRSARAARRQQCAARSRRGEQHRLDVGLIVQRSGEAQCRRRLPRSDISRDRHTVRHRRAPSRRRRSGAANAHPPRRRRRWRRSCAPCGGRTRRNTDLAQCAIALTQIAVGQEAAPELQRIAVDPSTTARGRSPRPNHRASRRPTPAHDRSAPADRAIQRGAQRGLVEAPRIGEAAATQRHRHVPRSARIRRGGDISVIDQRVAS